jgi:hypothetical protein
MHRSYAEDDSTLSGSDDEYYPGPSKRARRARSPGASGLLRAADPATAANPLLNLLTIAAEMEEGDEVSEFY